MEITVTIKFNGYFVERGLFFEHEYFNHELIERRYIFGVKGDFVVPWAFFLRIF